MSYETGHIGVLVVVILLMAWALILWTFWHADAFAQKTKLRIWLRGLAVTWFAAMIGGCSVYYRAEHPYLATLGGCALFGWIVTFCVVVLMIGDAPGKRDHHPQ